jgi:hypothetical protein
LQSWRAALGLSVPHRHPEYAVNPNDSPRLQLVTVQASVLQRDAKGGKAEGGGKQAGNREEHAGSRPSNTGRHRTQQRRKKPRWSTNQPEQRKFTTAHSTIQNKPGPPGHPHRHQMGTSARGTRQPDQQDKRKGDTRRHATEASGKSLCQNPPSPGSERAHGPPVQKEEGQQAAARSRVAESRRPGAKAGWE